MDIVAVVTALIGSFLGGIFLGYGWVAFRRFVSAST